MAERLILHAGMPKAGSSALQATLARAHPALLRKGVLYPKTWEGHQNFAVSGIVSYARLPRLYKQAYAGHASDLQYDFSKYWSHIVRQIDKHNPRTVILSGEAFFRDLSAAELETVRALLSPLAKVLEVVFYVRRPSEYYLSSVQQALKASHKLKRIRAVKYRAKIEPYMNIADKVHVISFNRDLFANNDIAMDFAGRFISD